MMRPRLPSTLSLSGPGSTAGHLSKSAGALRISFCEPDCHVHEVETTKHIMNHEYKKWTALLAIGIAPALFAQQPKRSASGKPYQAKSSSNISFNVKDGAETIEITNVAYEVVGPGIPGRPGAERLVLRKTLRSKQISDEIDIEAASTVEVWPLGV